MGTLPNQYQRVKSLVSTGTQYIELATSTDILNSSFEVKFNPTVNGNTGMIINLGGRTENYIGSFNSVSWGCYFNAVKFSVVPSLIYDSWHTIKYENNTMYLDDVQKAQFTDFTIGNKIKLFYYSSSSGMGHYKLASFVYEDSEHSYNLIPCYRKNDSLAGLYDLTNSGKNLYDKSNVTNGYFISAGGTITQNDDFCYSALIPCKPNTVYTYSSICGQNGNVRLHAYDENGNWIEQLNGDGGTVGQIHSFNGTTPSNAKYLRLSIVIANTNVQLEENTSRTEYEPYPFYTNQGTGSFVVEPLDDVIKSIIPAQKVGSTPRLPLAYQEVEYLQSSGTQYIDTGVIPNQDTSFEVKANLISGTDLGGFGWADNAIDYPYGFMCYGGTFYVGYNQTVSLGNTSDFLGVDKTYKIDKNLIYIDNVLVRTIGQSTFTPDKTLPLFAFKRTNGIVGYGTLKMYYTKLWDNNTLVRNLIPCYRKNDSLAGMYDLAWDGSQYGSVDMGTLDWTRNVVQGVYYFYANLPSQIAATNKAYCEHYTIGPHTLVVQLNDKEMLVHTQSSGRIFVRDDSYTDETTFKNSLSGKILYYQRTTDTTWTSPFYTNSGTGSFVVGESIVSAEIKPITMAIKVGEDRLPSTYQEVEYIQNTSHAKIDTGVILDGSSFSYEVDFKPTINNGTIIGNQSNVCMLYRSNGNLYGPLFKVSGNTPWATNERKTVIATYDGETYARAVTLDGTTLTGTQRLTPNTQTLKLLDNTGYTDYGIGYLYSAKITLGGTLIRHLVPCYRKSDSVAGMYDLTNSGKNLFDENQAFTQGFINGSGVLVDDSLLHTTNGYIPVEPNTTYTFSFNIGGSTLPISYFNISAWDTNQTFIDRIVREIANLGANTFTFTTPSNCHYLRFTTYINNQTDTQLELGSTKTSYEPYPFYTNAGTGSFVVGQDVNQQTLKMVLTAIKKTN